MESSKLFKMLVVAVALQSSSNAFSMDLYGDNGVQGLVAQYQSGKSEVADSLLKEMPDNSSAHRQETILGFFGKVKGDHFTAASLDYAFSKVRREVAEKAQKLAVVDKTAGVAAQKSRAQKVTEFVINNKKAIAGGTVAVAAIAAAICKRDYLKKAASDLASNVANSSYVKSAMDKGSALKASAYGKLASAGNSVMQKGSSVTTYASDKLVSAGNSVRAKLPSMSRISNLFANSAATAAVGAVASATTAAPVAYSATSSN